MRFTHTIKNYDPSQSRTNFNEKWDVDGVTEWDGRAEIAVTVSRSATRAKREVIQAAVDHEIGHAAQFASGEISPDTSTWKDADRFQWEVTAWASRAGAKRFGRGVGELVLDALNTYRRSLRVPEGEWLMARASVQSWCDDDLSDYEPLEPDPKDTPPCLLHGEPREDGTPAPGNGSVEEEQECREERERRAGDGEEEQQSGGVSGQEDLDERRTERDRWLHSPAGVAAARGGKLVLANELGQRDWDLDKLPPLTEAILGGPIL